MASSPRMFLVAVHGVVPLGKPLPLRPTALGVQAIPIAEVLPESCESQQRNYSIKSFATLADISESTVKREIKAKRLKAQKLRRRTVIAHEDAMAYLASLRSVDSSHLSEAHEEQAPMDRGE